MQKYFKQYRPFFIFLLKFFSVYVGLTIIYQTYLNQFENPLLFQVDDFTQFVARQTQTTLQFFNFDSNIELNSNQAYVKLFIEHVYVARVVEGCNALSVIILFAAFVVAFAGKRLHTIIFIVLGSVLIHILNVFRIALLCIALLHYPKQEHLLHDIVFPLFIYGCVFGLWVIWVNKFSFHARKNTK